MLYLYNETSTPWTAEKLSGAIVRLAKDKLIKKKDEPTKPRTVSIIAHDKLFPDAPKLNAEMAAVVKSRLVVCLDETKNSLVFNQKALQPFIIAHDERTKDIVLASFVLRDYKVLGIRSNGSFLLEYLMLAGELSIIGSLNNEGASIVIELLHQKTQQVTVHTIMRTDAGVQVKTTKRKPIKAELLLNKEVIRKFRPSHPTHIILTRPEDKEVLMKVVDPSYHEIIEYTDETFLDVVTRLTNSKYRAVTLFTDIPSEGRVSPKQFSSYAMDLDKLATKFFTIFKMHNDGKIRKIKY